MAIDSSIYNKIADVKPSDFASNFNEGIRMSELLQKRQDDNMTRQIMKESIVQNVDGTQAIDFNKGFGSLLSKGLTDQAIHLKSVQAQQIQMQQQQQQLQELKNQKENQYTVGLIDPILKAPKEQRPQAFSAALDQAEKEGHGEAVNQIRQIMNKQGGYTDDLANQILYKAQKSSVPYEKWVEQQQKDREFGLKSKLDQSEIEKNKSTVNKNNYDINVGKVDKETAKLTYDLTKGWTGRSGQAGKVQEKINNADAVQQLLDQGKTQDGGLDSRQMEEAALAAGRLLGATAMSQVQALLPKTLLGKAMSVAEFIDNNPHGAQQQAFANRLEETVKREKNLALDQKREYQISMLGAHQGLAKRNPEAYKAELIRQGIDPDMIDKNGRYKKPQDNSHPVDKMTDEEVKAAYEAKFGKSK
jgi:hypothetical protein